MNQIHRRFEGTILVGELPAAIRDQLGLPADSEVRVIVEPSSRTARDRMSEIMDQMSAEAAANGLTEEILEEILNEK
jgi:antitoxin component of MazEF toxin-antitoxin module